MLRYVPENRSSPRVVTEKWLFIYLFIYYKLTTRPKIKPGPFHKLNIIKRATYSD
jgi:hypothetical protein